MTEEIKLNQVINRMTIKEFRELGFLHEINRQVLHPVGLALEVIVDEQTGEEELGGVWDYRDDAEGIFFDNETLDGTKIEQIEDMVNSKRIGRLLYARENNFKIDKNSRQIPSKD